MKRYIVGAIALVLAACSSVLVAEILKAEPSAQTAEVESSVEAIPLNTAQSVQGNREVTVLRSESLETITAEFMEPVEEKGGKLIVVYVELKNTGNQSGSMMFTQFQLADSQGRQYDEISGLEQLTTVNSWLAAQGLGRSTDQMLPGGTNQTAKIFRVASDAEGFTLIVNDQVFVAG
ncbi:MAG: DUF4352 domain-containing protein [Leptolyngbyaceae cyanobacterium]